MPLYIYRLEKLFKNFNWRAVGRLAVGAKRERGGAGINNLTGYNLDNC